MKSRLAFAPLAVAVLIAATFLVAAAPAENQPPRLSLVRDWSSRHVIFSQPSSLMQAFRMSYEPRYIQQWIDRQGRWGLPGPLRHFPLPSDSLHRDWSVSLGSASTTVGQDEFPAKYSFNIGTASCTSDFVVFNTSQASSTQASIIAYNNLYSGCGGTVPSVMFAYDTGVAVTDSVTLSLDGTQLAFAESSLLILVKWSASASETATSPLNLLVSGNVTNASYRTCTAPCMTTVSLGASANGSSVFVDYGSDTAYVGDSSGRVNQVTGVFLGTPTRTTTTWPVTASSGKQLSSVVFDSASGNLFGTDTTGGHLFAICATSTCAGVSNGSVTTAIGTVTTSALLTGSGACYGTGGSTAANLTVPIIDIIAGRVYIGTGADGLGDSAVIQFSDTVSSTQFSQGSCGIAESRLTTGSTNQVFPGAFDNLYLSSGSSSSPTGNLYVCGNDGTSTLYRIPITANSMGSATSVLSIASASGVCSPVTEFYNANSGLDQVFFSTTTGGLTAAGCTSGSGCVVVVDVPTTSGGSLPTSTTAGLAASGGTSGIIIDNKILPASLSTSQVYFGTLSGATGVQASQSALQ